MSDHIAYVVHGNGTCIARHATDARKFGSHMIDITVRFFTVFFTYANIIVKIALANDIFDDFLWF